MERAQEQTLGWKMPTHRKWKLLSFEQIVWLVPGVFSALAAAQYGARTLFWVLAAVTFLGWVYTPYGVSWMLPLKLYKRLRIWRDRRVIYSMTLARASQATSEPATRPWRMYDAAHHSYLSFQDRDPDSGAPFIDYAGLFMDGNRTYGGTYVSATGWGKAATADAEARADYQTRKTQTLKDVANKASGIVQVAQIYLCRPDDQTPDGAYFQERGRTVTEDDEMAQKVALNVLEATELATGVTITRAISINTKLPPGWRRLLGKSSLDQGRRKTKKPLTRDAVFEQEPLSLAMTLRTGLQASGATGTEIMSVVDQVVLLGTALDAEESEQYFRTRADDLERLKRGEVTDLKDLRTLQLGPFPGTGKAGHDWILTGRTYNRIMLVPGFRARHYSQDFFEEVLEQLQLPCLVSTVWRTQPSRFEEIKREEKVRFFEAIREALNRGYSSESERSRESMEQIESERDETYLSRAPGISMLTLVVVHGHDLEMLKRNERAVRNLFDAYRIDLETVTGAENQQDFLLHALNLKRA